jgi:hypothetical protein
VSPAELAELRYCLGQLPPSPWRVGENYWELLDSRGAIVLRLETPSSRVAAPALARLVAALPGLLAAPPG